MSIISYLLYHDYTFAKLDEIFGIRISKHTTIQISNLIAKLNELQIKYEKTTESIIFFHDIPKDDLIISITSFSDHFTDANICNGCYNFNFNLKSLQNRNCVLKDNLLETIKNLSSSKDISVNKSGCKILFVLF